MDPFGKNEIDFGQLFGDFLSQFAPTKPRNILEEALSPWGPDILQFITPSDIDRIIELQEQKAAAKVWEQVDAGENERAKQGFFERIAEKVGELSVAGSYAAAEKLEKFGNLLERIAFKGNDVTEKTQELVEQEPELEPVTFASIDARHRAAIEAFSGKADLPIVSAAEAESSADFVQREMNLRSRSEAAEADVR